MDRNGSAHTLAGVLTRLQGGDPARDPELARRLDRAFAKHIRALTAFCAGQLVGFPRQQVDEVVQDVLLEAWAKLPSYRPDAPFRAFLFGIAALKCSNARRKRRDALSEDGFLTDPEDPAASPLAMLADAERDALVSEAAASALDPREQDLVHRRWVLDLPLDQIARELAFDDANAVRVALQRCRRRLDREVRRLVEARKLGVSFLR